MSLLSERPVPARLPVTALGPHFGAEIHGIDLARLDDDEVLALREALVAYKVLFVRGQHGLDDAAQIEFGRGWARSPPGIRSTTPVTWPPRCTRWTARTTGSRTSGTRT
ncbi:TauD/TfdA dioxygenase family protein [Streptomyces nogalater]